jgi:hypothetical protein
MGVAVAVGVGSRTAGRYRGGFECLSEIDAEHADRCLRAGFGFQRFANNLGSDLGADHRSRLQAADELSSPRIV